MCPVPAEYTQKFFNDSGFLRNINEVFPDGTELFMGITLRLEGGTWKQHRMFCKLKDVEKAKTKPKVNVKETEEMAANKKLTSEFNNAQLVEEEF